MANEASIGGVGGGMRTLSLSNGRARSSIELEISTVRGERGGS